MSPITEKAVEKGLELLDTATNLATGEAPKLLQEYLNYLLFVGVVDLLQVLAWGLIPYVIVKGLGRYISYLKSVVTSTKNSLGEGVCTKGLTDAQSNVSVTEMLRYFLVCGSIIVLAQASFGSMKNIGKLLIAPRVYLIQEGAKLFKKSPVETEAK